MSLVSNVSNCLATKINNNMQNSVSDFEKLKYGLNIIFINVSKIITLIVVAYILGVLKYTFLYFLCFTFVRSFAFGVHAEKSLNCTLSNLIIFIGGSYFSSLLKLQNNIIIFIFVVILIIMYKYAPADTKSRPIISKKLRRKLKIKALISTLTLMIIALIIQNNICKNIITLSVISESVCIIPLTYKILKKEYNNYERFIKQGI